MELENTVKVCSGSGVGGAAVLAFSLTGSMLLEGPRRSLHCWLWNSCLTQSHVWFSTPPRLWAAQLFWEASSNAWLAPDWKTSVTEWFGLKGTSKVLQSNPQLWWIGAPATRSPCSELGCFQGWGIHPFFGQSVPVFPTLIVKKPLVSNVDQPSFSENHYPFSYHNTICKK